MGIWGTLLGTGLEGEGAPPGRLSMADRLVALQVEVLYRQSWLAYGGSLLVALLLVAVLWDHTARDRLLGWFLVLAAVYGGRYWLGLRFERQGGAGTSPLAWRRRFADGAAASGTVWGLGALLVNPDVCPVHWMAYAICVAGLGAAALAVYAVVLRVYLAFLIPAMLPATIQVTLSGWDLENVITLVLAAFFGLVALSAWRANQLTEATLRLSLENQELAARLRADLERGHEVEHRLRELMRKEEALTRRLRQLSVEDGLTGLANRRQFDQVLRREWARARRGRYPVALVMFDLDHFKPYNDRYGHQAGDRCLRRVADVLKGFSRRPADVAARYGGEEFALVLPGSRTVDGVVIAEQVRAEVEALEILHEASSVASVITVSAGVASLSPNGDAPPQTLVELADLALYEAKAQGRNQVRVSHADGPPRGRPRASGVG